MFSTRALTSQWLKAAHCALLCGALAAVMPAQVQAQPQTGPVDPAFAEVDQLMRG